MEQGTPHRDEIPRERLVFLDGLRGLALIFMVLNHTARWWMDGSMGWGRYQLIYVTLTLAAPIFLFLVGFCLPLSFRDARSTRPWTDIVGKYVRRGAGIILAGYLLNLVVFPEDPLLGSGVLHTIGFSIILLIPCAYLMPYRPARYGLALLAALLYLAFSSAHPGLVGWVAAHPRVSEVLFFDFPLWPWFGIVLIGLVLGWAYAEQRGPQERARYFRVLGLIAVACLLVVLAWDWWAGTSPRLTLKRDFSLNGHWTPQGLTTVWIMGAVLGLLAATYYLMEVKRVRPQWLVTFGQAALMLYVVHQVIALTLINRALDLLMNDWWQYGLANALFLAALGGLGRIWLVLRRTLHHHVRARLVQRPV